MLFMCKDIDGSNESQVSIKGIQTKQESNVNLRLVVDLYGVRVACLHGMQEI